MVFHMPLHLCTTSLFLVQSAQGATWATPKSGADHRRSEDKKRARKIGFKGWVFMLKSKIWYHLIWEIIEIIVYGHWTIYILWIWISLDMGHDICGDCAVMLGTPHLSCIFGVARIFLWLFCIHNIMKFFGGATSRLSLLEECPNPW